MKRSAHVLMPRGEHLIRPLCADGTNLEDCLLAHRTQTIGEHLYLSPWIWSDIWTQVAGNGIRLPERSLLLPRFDRDRECLYNEMYLILSSCIFEKYIFYNWKYPKKRQACHSPCNRKRCISTISFLLIYKHNIGGFVHACLKIPPVLVQSCWMVLSFNSFIGKTFAVPRVSK